MALEPEGLGLGKHLAIMVGGADVHLDHPTRGDRVGP